MIRETNSGLIVGSQSAAFMESIRRKADKKVTKPTSKLHSRNCQMLELVRAVGNQPLLNHDGYPVTYINNPFIPPKWTDTTHKLKTIYCQRALDSFGEPYTLNFNIFSAHVQKALKNGGLDYIRRGVSRALKRKLGRTVEFWFVLEMTITNEYDQKLREIYREKAKAGEIDWKWFHSAKARTSMHYGRPHIHGALLIADSEITDVRSALHVINKSTNKNFNKLETVFKPVDNGVGWADYATKDLGLTQVFIPNSKLITCTNAVSKRAKQLYETDRQSMISFRKETSGS